MSIDAVESWLKRKLASRLIGALVMAVLAAVAGAVALFLTFWLAYAVTFVAELAASAVGELIWNRRVHLSHGWRLALSGLFLLALFVEWLRRSPWDLGNYPNVNAPPFSNAAVFQAGALGGIAVLLANPQASSTMITELLYTGPRLVTAAWRLLREGFRLRRVDQRACAWGLALLANRDGAVLQDELVTIWPDVDISRLHRDLSVIPGVVLLEKGLTLTAELRSELRSLATP